uniref:Uncharacterized protein LOC103944405 n=1 Tax=Rhizophora mucronata TaxID=61149 RepID=A0A2P2KQW7_RHIMU
MRMNWKSPKSTQNAFGCFARYAVRRAALSFSKTGRASPCRVITRSVLSSGSLATSNEHLGLANRS